MECGGKRSATPLSICQRSSFHTKAPSPLRSAGALEKLPTNLKVGRDSVELWNSSGATHIRARRSLALPSEISSWSHCMRKSERRLSMNISVLPASCRQKTLSSAAPSSVAELPRRVAETSAASSLGAPSLCGSSWLRGAIMESWRLAIFLELFAETNDRWDSFSLDGKIRENSGFAESARRREPRLWP